VKQAGGGRHAVDLLSKAMPDYREKIVQLLTAQKIQATEQNVANAMQGKGAAGARILAAAQEEAAVSAENQAKGVAELAGSAQAAKGNIDDLEKAIEGFGSTTLDARAAQAAMQEAIEKATKEIGKNGKGINLHTKAGRENDAMLRDLASSTAAAAGKTLKMTGSAKDAENQMKEGRAAFIRAAAAAGIVGQKAEDLADKYGLIPKNVNTAVHVTGYASAATTVAKIQAELDKLHNKSVSVFVDGKTGQVGAAYSDAREGNAGGGAIIGGPKGVDTHLRRLAGGEHVFTAAEVDAMGGQDAVYRFRKEIRGGAPGMAAGGAVPAKSHAFSEQGMRAPRGTSKAPTWGGIWDQTVKAVNAEADRAYYQDQLDDARARLRRQERAASDAQKAVEAARTHAADIHGKGTADEKHAAEMHARALARAAKDADARVKATEKRVTAAEKDRDEAKDARDAARAAQAQIKLGREDFQSAERRDPNRRETDPLAYVDQLRSMSRDEDFSPTRRKAMKDAANQYERSLVTLTKAGEEAAKKLDTLKQSSEQMRDSIRSTIAGGSTLGGYQQEEASSFQALLADFQKQKQTPTAVAGAWQERNGIRFRTYSTSEQADPTQAAPTASGIARYYAIGATRANDFARALRDLAGKGISSELLAQLAGMGTEAGMPIAQALLSGSSADLASINASYRSLGDAGLAAGTTVADANFAAQIAAADANAEKITAQIKTDGEALRKLIARAFGLKGYASGTDSATPGIHLVGEQGPELVGFRGGEKVLRAQDTARWVRGAASAGGSGSGISFSVAMPQSLDLVDAGGGLISTVRVVARDVAVQEIAADALQDAVLMGGGAA
jgi:hypothetical protein